MKKHLPILLVTLFSLLYGCSSGTNSSDNHVSGDISIEGEWVSESQTAKTVWSFNNGAFTKTTEYTDESSQDLDTGTYSIGFEIMLSSGLSANNLDLLYTHRDPIDNKTSYGGETSPKKLDLVYINNGSIYFGNKNINETCEGEFYQEQIFELFIIGNIPGIKDTIFCYSRPTSLNFNFPYDSN